MNILNRISRINHLYNKKGFKAIANKCEAVVRYKMKTPLASTFPTAIMLEPTNICNLKCPTCPAGTGKLKRKPGYMSLEQFKQIVDETGDCIINMTLHNYGESFLHKNFLDMVEYASTKGILCHVSTNGHFFKDEEFCKRLVRSGLRNLKISLDGASQETYEKFRLSGDFNKIIEGTKMLMETKKKLRADYPVVVFQFILMKPNENEVHTVKEIAERVGIDKLQIKSVGVSMRDSDFELLVKEYLPENEVLSRFIKKDGKYYLRKTVKPGCWWVYEQIVINYDGSVVPCCYDMYDDIVLGNVFRDGGVRKIWNSREYQNLRIRLWREKEKIPLCSVCPEASITSMTDVFQRYSF